MSARAARLFAFLQGADFYAGFHREAAARLPPGEGRSWLDAGCGPGLLARLAAGKGYAARGIDLDPDMIAAARGAAAGMANAPEFEAASFAALRERGERYDVVSASSLLVVLPDAADGLRQLLALLKPGGRLLVIEASPGFTRWRALKAVASGRLGARAYMLLLWASGRAGRTLRTDIFTAAGLKASRHGLLNGLVDAWIVQMAA